MLIDVAERLKTLMKERGWTVYRLSEESGVPRSTLSGIFSRRTQPSLHTLSQICDGLNITMSQFFRTEEEITAEAEESEEVLHIWRSMSQEQRRAWITVLSEKDK